jgi:medium-chain acyl-[acyl-carrier-protein] hydrolase
MTLTPASSRWFFQPKRHPQSRLRLFCFPHAGGAATIFSNWSHALPAGVEVWPVQLPGRQNRLSEPAFTQISEIVQALAPVIQEYLDIPFAFFGHCMGAHVSFELARQLRGQAAPLPEHLFVAARRAPQLPDPNAHFYHLSGPIFLKAVSNQNALPAEFVENQELVSLMLPTLRADFEAVETYTYAAGEPLECAISAFGGTEDYSVSPDELLEWRNQTTGAFRFHLFSGDHFFIQSHQPGVLRTISQELRKLIPER